MTFLTGLITVLLVLNCLLLTLLVLVQLPKKDAGAGMAFGGGAADAIFGAGSGSALTRITKYAAGSFFVFALLLAMMQSHLREQPDRLLEQMRQPGPAARTVPVTTPSPTQPADTSTDVLAPRAPADPEE